MRPSLLIGLFAVSLSVSPCCGRQSGSGTQGAPEAAEPLPQTQPIEPSTELLPTCCADQEELASLDGQRVQVRGVYNKVNVSRRPPPLDLTVPGNASVLTGSVGVMLGVYYEASAVRTVQEIRQLHDSEVIVIGTIHERTPAQLHDGMPMQTMIGPYIEVESLAAVNVPTAPAP